MNALEDTREIASLERTLGSRDAYATVRAAERAYEFGALIGQMIRQYPDIDLPTIRLSETGDRIQVTGRRGQLALPPIECPQCHQPIGRPHTEFCTLAPDRVWPETHSMAPPGSWVHRHADGWNWTHPPGSTCELGVPEGHHLVHSEAFIDQDDPRSQGALTCGFRNLENPDIGCDYPPHPIGTAHSWQP